MFLRMKYQDFPGGLVVKILCFWCKGLRFGPGQGTKTPHTMGQRKINKYNAVLALERETLARTSSIFFFPESFVAKWGLWQYL